MSTFKLNRLQPWLRPYAEASLDYFQFVTGGQRDVKGRIQGGVRPTVTSGFRTNVEQQALYAARASNPYPVNRPGDSAHEYGLAFDSAVPDRYLPAWTALRRAIGFRVPENDEVHAEVPGWREIVSPARS